MRLVCRHGRARLATNQLNSNRALSLIASPSFFTLPPPAAAALRTGSIAVRRFHSLLVPIVARCAATSSLRWRRDPSHPFSRTPSQAVGPNLLGQTIPQQAVPPAVEHGPAAV